MAAHVLFTLPLSATGWEDAERAATILATVDFAPHPGWQQIRPGHIHGPIRPL